MKNGRKDKLARTQERLGVFVDALIANGGVKSKAAEACGFKAGPSAQRMGVEYAKHPWVVEEYARRRKEASKQRNLTANGTFQSCARDVNFDPARLYWTEGPRKGQLKQIWEMDEDTRLALRGMKLDEDGHVSEVKFPEKTAAREQAMKHFGLYERDNKQKPFYTPPQIVVVPVPGRGHSDPSVRRPPVNVISVKPEKG